MRRILAAAALGLMACTASWAHDAEHDEATHSHWWLGLDLDLAWYAGAGIGQSQFDDYAFFNDGSFTSQSKDDTGTSLRLFGGLAFGRYLALELGYADFDEASFRAQSDGSGSLFDAGPQSVKVAADGYDLSLVGRLPLGDWGLFAKVGNTWWESKAPVAFDLQSQGAIATTLSDDGSAISYGAGVQYDALRPLRLVGEYGVLPLEAEFIDDATLDWFMVSVAYLF